jgi:hypothetical protein
MRTIVPMEALHAVSILSIHINTAYIQHTQREHAHSVNFRASRHLDPPQYRHRDQRARPVGNDTRNSEDAHRKREFVVIGRLASSDSRLPHGRHWLTDCAKDGERDDGADPRDGDETPQDPAVDLRGRDAQQRRANGRLDEGRRHRVDEEGDEVPFYLHLLRVGVRGALDVVRAAAEGYGDVGADGVAERNGLYRSL